MTKHPSVLIIEDDIDIAQLVSIQVAELNGESQITDSIETASKLSQFETFDLIVLDLSLPDGDGIEFCKSFRKHNEHTPILMLTARSNEIDRVIGLEMGADDYLSKPFGLAELKARMKALLRRSQINETSNLQPEEIQVGHLKIHTKNHQIWLDGAELTLTSKEFDILLLMAQNPNQVFSRLDLLEKVWGIQHDGYEHTVNTHLNRLRKKIEQDPANPKIIETIWGVGYKLNSMALS